MCSSDLLRGQAIPAFQDTYGWIAFRRGNLDEAKSHLEPAAAGLPEDALVQMHLGLLYERLSRREEAVSQLERALALGAAQVDTPAGAAIESALDEARVALERLRATPAPSPAPESPVGAASGGAPDTAPAGGGTAAPPAAPVKP